MTIRCFASGKCSIQIDGEVYSFRKQLCDDEHIRVRTNPKNGVVYEIHGQITEISRNNNYADFYLDGGCYMIEL